MNNYKNIINKYCVGDGVFAGKDPYGIHKWVYNAEPDNYYRMISKVPPETADYILVSQGFFGTTKYDEILLKEWFYALKLGGKIILPVIYKDSAKLLYTLINNFYPSKALKIIHNEDYENLSFFIIDKIHPALAINDSIDSWTFGIISDGKRNSQVDDIVESIHKQNIPNYEIIVCGTYYDRQEEFFRYIHFTENDEKGWISRKKNIICEQAQFENLAIVHDRVTFGDDWYEGMKIYGNYFDALCCVQNLRSTEIRLVDWWTWHEDIKAPPIKNFFLKAWFSKPIHRDSMNLNYDDWDNNVIMNGGLTIFKHSLWKLVNWNENVFWTTSTHGMLCEDIDLSRRLNGVGAIIRFNPFSHCPNLSWRRSLISTVKKDIKKLSYEFEEDNLSHKIFLYKYYAKDYIIGEFNRIKRIFYRLIKTQLIKISDRHFKRGDENTQ